VGKQSVWDLGVKSGRGSSGYRRTSKRPETRISGKYKRKGKQTVPESLYLLHFTESLDDTQVTRKYPDLAQKPANPELLVFVGSHTRDFHVPPIVARNPSHPQICDGCYAREMTTVKLGQALEFLMRVSNVSAFRCFEFKQTQ
jgi:hypothetical protein